MKKIFFYLFSFFVLCLIFNSCGNKKDDPIPSVIVNDTLSRYYDANKWILSQMGIYYYWTDKLPTNPTLSVEPEAFFESLLYKAEDRFSWIQNAADLQNSLNGINKSTGFEMKLYRIAEGSDKLIGQVLYVFPNTPASRAGIKRGDIFTMVNDQVITISNYEELLFGDNSSTQKIGFVTISENGFNYSKTVTIVTEEITENPIMLDSVYTLGSKKIGYFAYKNFIPDPGNKTLVYDNKMIEIFGKFKSAGINELVLDLRLNTGGAITSAVKLASLIVKGATSNDILLREKYNTLLTNEIRSSEGDAAFYTKFSNQANNVGSLISKLVVLTSNHTASASELIINGLRPYMDVVLIGDITYGKNVGSITITDSKKKITWGLQPIIVKLFNKNNESDYTKGFVPNYVDIDNHLDLFPFGDLREPLLRIAITKVYGIALDDIVPLKAKGQGFGNEVATSVSFKRNAYTTSMDK